MSYDNLTPPEHGLRYPQRGDFGGYQAWLNHFPITQYAVLPSNHPAGFSAGPQSQIPPYSTATNATSAYPTYPRPFQYQISLPPGGVHQAHFMHAVPPTMVDQSTRNTLPAAPERYGSAQSEGHQHRAQHQHRRSYLHRSHSVPMNLATIHPDLGLCMLVPIAGPDRGAPQSHDGRMAVDNAGFSRGDYYASRLDRLRRLRGHQADNDFLRSTTASPSRSPSPYISTPSSSPTVTPTSELPSHLRDARGSRRSLSPPRLHGHGDYDRRRSRSESRPGREASISTVETCSECRGARAGSVSEPACSIRGGGFAAEGLDEEGPKARWEQVEDRDLRDSVEADD